MRTILPVLFLSCAAAPYPTGPGPDAGHTDAGADGGSTDAGVQPSDAGPWQWVPIAGTQCGSGSGAGLGLAESPTRDDQLFLFLQGGGACWNTGTCVPSLVQFGPLCDYGQACLLNLAGGQLPAASDVQGDPFPADGGGDFPSELAAVTSSAMLDRRRADNPFKDATWVFVPYCTGDLHAGDATRDYQYKYNLFDQPSTFTMHFKGAVNVALDLAWLAARYPNVKTVWLTGASAGALGASLNFERVRAAFPAAQVHLLADSGPLLPTVHWAEWRDTWNLQLPANCPACDAGFGGIIEHAIAADATSRIALLSNDHDKVIAYYFDAPPGAAAGLNPPIDQFNADLRALEGTYDLHANSKYFVIAGTDHVLLPGYGVQLADGGVSAPVKSNDAGTTLRAFIDAWATGAPGWSSSR